MNHWTIQELTAIESAEELEIASGGRRFVVIWSVRVGDQIYVRSYKGKGNGWFRRALQEGQGHIQAGGVERAVDFEVVSAPPLQALIDAAYTAKYKQYPASYTESVTNAAAHGATLRLVPR